MTPAIIAVAKIGPFGPMISLSFEASNRCMISGGMSMIDIAIADRVVGTFELMSTIVGVLVWSSRWLKASLLNVLHNRLGRCLRVLRIPLTKRIAATQDACMDTTDR